MTYGYLDVEKIYADHILPYKNIQCKNKIKEETFPDPFYVTVKVNHIMRNILIKI